MMTGATLASLPAGTTVSIRNTWTSGVNTATLNQGTESAYSGEIYIQKVG